MPLSKEAQEKLLKALKADQTVIDKVLSDEEVDFDPGDVHIYTKPDLDELEKNIKIRHDKSYQEILAKQLNDKHKLGLTGADAKDLEKVHAAMTAKALEAANIAPDEKVKKLETDLQTLRTNFTEVETREKTWEQKYKDREQNDEYRNRFFDPERNDALTDQEWVMRLRNTVKWREEDGKTIYTDVASGKDYTDNKLNPLTIDEVKAKLYEKPNWKKAKAAETKDDDTNPDPRRRNMNPNPARTAGVKKYSSAEEITKMVDKKYPLGSKVKGLNKLRSDYYRELAAMKA